MRSRDTENEQAVANAGNVYGRGKPGPDSVNPSSRGSNPVGNSPGSPGESMPAQPIPGPAGGTGLPPALRKALAKKPMPNRGRDSPGRY